MFVDVGDLAACAVLDSGLSVWPVLGVERDEVAVAQAVVDVGEGVSWWPSSPRSARRCCARALRRSISWFEAFAISATERMSSCSLVSCPMLGRRSRLLGRGCPRGAAVQGVVVRHRALGFAGA